MLALTGALTAAGAQDTADESTAAKETRVLEVVTVVAERRASNLQDVPVAVTAIGGTQIREGGITNIEDVGLRVPNTKINTFNIGEPQIYIRGIGNTSDSIGSDPAVGLFLDDVYISRTGAASFNLYDLERIEVLRGPQGALYGKNVIGGAISVVTREPSFEFAGRAGVTVGKYGLLATQAYVNGPLTENLAGKFVLSRRTRDGYANNINNGQELDDEDNLSLRGQLLYRVSDTVEVLLGADYSKDDTNGRCRTLQQTDLSLQSGLGLRFAALEEASVKSEGADDIRTCTHSLVQNGDKELGGFLARVNADLGWAELVSITAGRHSEFEWIQDLGGIDSPPRLIGVFDSAREDAWQVSQEFRLSGSTYSGFDWVAGVFYLRETSKRSENFVDNFEFAPFDPFEGDVTFFQDGEVESYAVFADVKYPLTDTLTIGAGVRYSEDQKTLRQAAEDNIRDGSPAAIPLGPGVPYVAEAADSWGEVTPRASIEWRPDDNVLTYISYAEGFKSGAFPSQATSTAVAKVALDPEEATNIEVGAKTEWLNNRLRFNIAAFDLEYTNLQVFSLINLQLISENADKASVQGVEVDFAAALGDSLTLSGNFAVMDARYDDYVVTNSATGTVNDNSGNKLARAPKTTWSLAADYRRPLSLGPKTGEIDFNVILTHSGDFFFEANNDPRSKFDAFEVLNASFGYTSPSERFELRIWSKNLTDEDYPVHSINATFGGAVRLFAPPLTYGVTTSVRF